MNSTPALSSTSGGPTQNIWRREFTDSMVSHAEIAESSRRRATSVSSTSQSGRPRHHHSRSGSHHRRHHHGSTATLVKNEFPFFAQTGDVEIVIQCDGQEKKYLLHRLMLAQFSGFFDAGMSDEWSRVHAKRELERQQALSVIGEESSSHTSTPLVTPEQASRSIPGQKRWHYELNWDAVGENEEPSLVQKPPQYQSFVPTAISATVLSPPPSHSFFRSMANLSVRPTQNVHSQSAANLALPVDPASTSPLIRDYDNLFRIFYNYPPALNTLNIASAYSECKSLLGLADMYDALSVVGPRIEHHLLAFSSRLFKQIAKYPPSYLKLGYLCRSRVIFSEALTHVVGQWPQAYPYLKPSNQFTGYEVPLHVLDLIEDKVDELEELRSKIESRLFRLTLTTSRGERVNPSNDYLGWLAMSLFRQWVAENTTPEVRGILKPPTSRPSTGNSNALPTQPSGLPPANSGRIFRLLSSTSTESYLPHDELKRFLKLQPTSSASSSLYSRDNLRRFERKMEQIKNLARNIVNPLTRNCLELDLRLLGNSEGGGLGYLTCTKVEDEDIPWS